MNLASVYEGYAGKGSWHDDRDRDGNVDLHERLDETALRGIIEGVGVTFTAAMPGRGLSYYTWRHGGSILFYGGMNFALEMGVSYSRTWYISNGPGDWDWVDQIPGYDASILERPNPSDGQGCDCD